MPSAGPREKPSPIRKSKRQPLLRAVLHPRYKPVQEPTVEWLVLELLKKAPAIFVGDRVVAVLHVPDHVVSHFDGPAVRPEPESLEEPVGLIISVSPSR